MTPRTKNKPLPLYKKGFLCIFLIIGSLVTLTVIFTAYDLDRQIAGFFYTPEEEWLLLEKQPWKWLYSYGTIPGLLFTIGGVIVLFLTYIRPQLYSWRRYVMVIVLTSVVGGGIIVNGILKDYWGRTRPRQIQEFGGRWEYLDVTQPGIPGKGKSFPCGHCTISYIFVTSIFLHRKSRWISWTGTITGILYGGLMSVARIGQGGHFPTDTYWALGVVLLTASLLYYFILRPPHYIIYQTTPPSKKKVIGISTGTICLIVVMVFLFLTRRPVFEDHQHGLSLYQDTKEIQLHTNIDRGDIKIKSDEGKTPHIRTIVRGFGWPEAYHELHVQRISRQGGLFYIDYQLIGHGYFSELNMEMSLHLPEHLHSRVILMPSEKTEIPQKK
ncbi:MAG: phosphatase PAP2 family protein [SAR324 cluster bacterium]|nr:phosphatase PAP2 family protein [SAR324 cluster bacterium]